VSLSYQSGGPQCWKGKWTFKLYHKIKRHFKKPLAFQSVQLKINPLLNSLEKKTKGRALALAENNENLFASFDGQGFLRLLLLDLGKSPLEWVEDQGLCYVQ